MSDRTFDKALEQGFAAMRAQRGPCPTPEKLGALAAGELVGTEAEAVIREHVAVCGVCDAILVRLRSFEEAAREKGEGRILGKGYPHRPAGRLLAFAGYGIAAGVTIAAYLGVMPRRSGQPEPIWDVVETLDLNRVRGAQTATAMNASTRLVVLSFFVDARPDLAYEAVLDGGEAQRITSFDRLGNFHLVVNRRLLGRGRHVLKVREGETRTVEFSFEVE